MISSCENEVNDIILVLIAKFCCVESEMFWY